MTQPKYPGVTHHQQVLQAIVDYYSNDKRIRAVGLFGSLSRGDWDEFSDLDLDVVIDDQIQVNAVAEIERLCPALSVIGEDVLLIIPDGPDAGDVVCASLLELSIRYHTLATTNWKIIDSLVLLAGSLDLATIVAAGNRNRTAVAAQLPANLLDRYLRYACGVSVQISRQQIWNAIDLLHRMRDLLMQLYALTHGYSRPVHAFQRYATQSLQASLAAMLPQYKLESVCLALHHALNVVENDLSALSNGQIELSDVQRKLLKGIHQRIDQE